MTTDGPRQTGQPRAERTEPQAAPCVTIVVIVYNDAEALPVAVRSALRQTMTDLEVVIVDDASSDGSAAAADMLAAADPRVRVVRRQVNSGGCSAPRNDGVATARGRWLMFLDSDDELPPRAAQLLVSAAERTGADLASGRTQRYHVRARAVSPWYPHLYREEKVVEGLASWPDLLQDALATNKAYRREFLSKSGLRFVEGIHYEDQVFSMAAYLAAARMVLVPHPVYRWNVREADPLAAGRSITNRRAEIANLRSRLQANRLIDLAVDAAGIPAVRVTKDVKFVKHDLRLYLNDLWERDVEFRQAFMDEVGGYLRDLPGASWQQLPVLNRVAAALLVLGDLDGVLDAVEALRRANQLMVPLHRHEGRLYFPSPGVEPGSDDRLDVTGSPVGQAPAAAGRLDRIELVPDGLLVHLVIRYRLMVDEHGADVPPISVLAARFGLPRLGAPLEVMDIEPGPIRGSARVSVKLPTTRLRLLPGPLNVWRLRCLVEGRDVGVGRPHAWDGPVHLELRSSVGRSQPAVFGFSWAGDVQLVAASSRRLEERLGHLRLRLRHTKAGVTFRAAKAVRTTVRRRLGRRLGAHR